MASVSDISDSCKTKMASSSAQVKFDEFTRISDSRFKKIWQNGEEYYACKDFINMAERSKTDS